MATAEIPRTKVDPVEADSRHYSIEFENEKIRVVRIKYGAKEKFGHARPSGVGFCLSERLQSQIYLPGWEERRD